jgi:hypothetical protein
MTVRLTPKALITMQPSLQFGSMCGYLGAKVPMWLYLSIYFNHDKWHLSLNGLWAELDSWANFQLWINNFKLPY